MALIVESGTGLSDADSYASIADATAYAAAHGLTFPTVEADQEIRLRRATQYLDAQYSYKGVESTYTQALAWPRTVAPGVVPREIVNACIELACKAGDLWADVSASAVVEQTVGPITTKYSDPANGGQKRYASVDAMLRRWIAGGGGWNIPVVRA